MENERSDEAQSLDELLTEIDIRDSDWRLGNYQILEEIGRGGMGVIYRARQRHSRRVVALKRVLSYHSDSRETLERFRREAQAAASLDHPNILPIYEVGEAEGLPFFTMKYATGGTLQQAAPTLSGDTRECIRLLAKVARAVAYAHREGILHRDLKPGNILLDGRGEPMVSDFGLAKWIEANTNLTRSLAIFGTPGYIAPEQASGQRDSLTSAVDVYSLGAILFELLSGRPPFLGEHALAVIRQASEKSAPKLRSLVRSADRDLETICARSLEREPGARYRSAGDLAEDLERWLEGRPIIARPVSPPTQAWRWSKRNPKFALSLAACLGLSAAAFIWQAETRRLSAAVRRDRLVTRSIAVLPFLDLDQVRSDHTFSDQIARVLQTRLGKVAPTRIVPVARSEAWFAGTGNLRDLREANADTKARGILTGTQRLVDGKLRVLVRLMNAATGEVLFTRVFEVVPNANAPVETADAIQSTVHSLLDTEDWSAIAVTGRDPGLRNPAAREFILSGRELMFRQTVETIDKSIACLERAIELEPNSAIAHAFLATAACGRTHFISDNSFLERAELEAREAIRLDPDSADSHRALAGIAYRRGRFSEALVEEYRAVELAGPEERIAGFIGLTLDTLEEPNHSLGWYEIARHWEMRPGTNDACIGKCWIKLGDDQRAEAAFRRAADLRPEMSQGWAGLCYLRVLQGDMAEARALCQQNQDRFKDDNDSDQIRAFVAFAGRQYEEAETRYRALAERDSKGMNHFDSEISYDSIMGRLRQVAGDEASGRAILEESRARELNGLKTTPAGAATFYRLAAIEASLGHPEVSLDHLRAAINAGWLNYRSFQRDPRFDTLAPDNRFQELVSQLAEKVAELRRQIDQPEKLVARGEGSSPDRRQP